MVLLPEIEQLTGPSPSCKNLYAAGKSLAIAEMAKHTPGPVLVITEDSLAANTLALELEFFLAGTGIPALVFADWETLPYDHFSPHQDIISQRLTTLYQLPLLNKAVVIAPITTLMYRLAPKEYVESSSFVLKVGDVFDPVHMRLQLEKRGYYAVSQVLEHGEYCLRGSIFDLFPMGSNEPFRIDLFSDEVDSIATFDPQTQRSKDKIDSIKLLPAKEFPFDEAAISNFRQNWRANFAGNPSDCPIYKDVSQQIAPQGIEYYIPLFFAETNSLIDYLPQNTTIVRMANIDKAADLFWQEINERFEQLNIDRTRPLLAPNQVFFNSPEIFASIKPMKQIFLNKANSETKASAIDFHTQVPPEINVDYKLDDPLLKLNDFIVLHNYKILFAAESPGRREALIELFNNNKLHPHQVNSWQEFLSSEAKLNICVAPLAEGLILTKQRLCIISESQLFGNRVMQRRRRVKRRMEAEDMVHSLAELTIGAPVVHVDHGVGRYLGLETMESEDHAVEYLTLEYAGSDKLYVPISSLHLISRYSGVELENAPLHQLGSKKWQKAKEKAAKQIRDVAAELLEIYAKRASRKGYEFKIPQDQFIKFCNDFPFEETPDQESAIQSVCNDLQAQTPMDRLVCGDVGFGKTEVAMRAAFIAVNNNKQVAVLVPTTLLAQQHYASFKDRFADWPINIEVISRFRSSKEQTQILEKLESGKIDLIIGTHKLIQSSVKFDKLGLLIIDEEHRFGVGQKEKLKSLRSEVEILTLTATPIPRTLNLSLAGIRDLSIIATPPARRLSVKTFVHEYSKSLVIEAVLRELLRGGQVFFLHNNVQSIERVARELSELVPQARIGIGHGQMREKELEAVMADFYHQRLNILVCTTIIENGIDIPTANTIIIDKADHFGLAQLHQLRGRVGRSHHQAYAYLLTPPEKRMTKDAVKRLDAIVSAGDLGAGFNLASHDLEIRGAGEFLGEEQSGNIQTIGLSLYTELLELAVKSLQAGLKIDEDLKPKHGAEIDTQISTLIPESYVADVHTRLILYKRISNALEDSKLDDLQVEMIDRFGLLPQETKNLFRVTSLKLLADKIGIRKIKAGAKTVKFEFTEQPQIDPKVLIDLVQQQSQRYQLESGQNLRYHFASEMDQEKLSEIEELIKNIQLA